MREENPSSGGLNYGYGGGSYSNGTGWGHTDEQHVCRQADRHASEGSMIIEFGGYGHGYGYGDGDGHGYGIGSGSGNGYGIGSGNSNGYGDGHGDGNGWSNTNGKAECITSNTFAGKLVAMRAKLI